MSLAMSRRQREKFLSRVHVGIIAIPRPGRGPLTLPIWYDYHPGGDVWMITGRDSLKGKLLRETDRISLCVQSEKAPYRYVSVEGPFSISEPSEHQLLHMAVRYLGEEQGKRYAAASSDDDASIVVSIHPKTWMTVDYRKG